MDYNDISIHIDIQADPFAAIEIRELVRETFVYMPPWKAVGNAIFASSDSRFFSFNLTTYDFVWRRSNESYDDSMDEENTFVIHDTADMSWLLEFIALNQATFRKYSGLNLEKLKQKLDEYQKKANPPSPWSKPSEQDMADALLAIQPMAMPAAKVFYLDYIKDG